MYSTPMHLIRPCQHAPTRYCISCISAHTHTRPCIFAQSMVYARAAIDVLAPMCWRFPALVCSAMLLPCIFAQSMVYARVAIDVLAHVLACDFWRFRAWPCCACANAYARVPMCVLWPMSWHTCNARTHSRCARLADFCDGDVAPRSRKRSRRLPHAHLRVRIRMRVRARSCVRESLCLHSHMYAHA